MRLTVRKLIDALQECDPDADVGTDTGDGFYLHISGVKIVDSHDLYGGTYFNAVLLECEE